MEFYRRFSRGSFFNTGRMARHLNCASDWNSKSEQRKKASFSFCLRLTVFTHCPPRDSSIVCMAAAAVESAGALMMMLVRGQGGHLFRFLFGIAYSLA
jgi:hypothetical protein